MLGFFAFEGQILLQNCVARMPHLGCEIFRVTKASQTVHLTVIVRN